MTNRGRASDRRLLIFGGVLILLGLASLLSVLFDVNFSAFCWPTGLILVGIWLLVRPRYTRPEGSVFVRLIGDLRRRHDWQVTDQDIWVIIGDTDLDLTEAIIPSGETAIRVYGFVGEVNVRAPMDIGVSISSTSFVSDSILWGEKRDYFLTPFTRTSEGYESADRRIKLEVIYFVVNLRVDQV